MGVITASNESNEAGVTKPRSDISLDSDCYSSGEETRLLKNTKDEESGGEKKKYPKSVLFIVGNEFCERFTYYGLRTVLILFLTKRLNYGDDVGMTIYHLFTMFCYFTPILGAIIADSWLGKYRTILYLSIFYALGSITLSAGAFPNDISTMSIISIIGLVIISIGTGGIKPCVSAFGGDQFQKGQEDQLQKFFSLFYVSINLGSLLSTFLTPILREDVHCLGEETCFPVAFGVPCVLMIVAILFFVAGKPFYTIKPPEGNIVVQVSKCIWHALRQKCKSSEKKRSHWLDYADDKYDKKLIGEIKILFRILVLYIPLPIFWSLFDQTGSRWTLQATLLDGVVGGYHIKADQMQVVNPLLIVAFIPLFEYGVYPLLKKCNLLTKPLQRITLGLFLASCSFAIAGYIQYLLEQALPIPPSPGMTKLTIMNNSPCNIKIQGTNISDITSDAFDSTIQSIEVVKGEDFAWNFIPENCSQATDSYKFSFTPNAQTEFIMITVDKKNIKVIQTDDDQTKSEKGNPRVRIFFNTELPQFGNMSFKFELEKSKNKYYFNSNTTESFGVSEYQDIYPGRYKIYAMSENKTYEDVPMGEYHFKSGGVYVINIYNKTEENSKTVTFHEIVKGNFISILVQIIPYSILTAGEIMFSVTGLEFSYNQAPTSMKSVIQSVWLLTVAIGNLIVVFVIKSKIFDEASYEMFLFSVLMVVSTIVFAFLAYRYKNIKNQDKEKADASPSGKTNGAYVEETDFNK